MQSSLVNIEFSIKRAHVAWPGEGGATPLTLTKGIQFVQSSEVYSVSPWWALSRRQTIKQA